MSKLSRVEVDCRAQKPCWVGERGRKREILWRTSLSKLLKEVQSREIEEERVGICQALKWG